MIKHSQGNTVHLGLFSGALKNSTGGKQLALTIYCDGCCEPNPGAAGWGFAVYRNGEEIAHDSAGLEHGTNNVAELSALIMALEWVSKNAPAEPVTIWSDSRYAVDGSNSWRHSWRAKGWSRKGAASIANLELWQAVDAALTSQPLISVEWCKGHAGIPGNVRADELASMGRTSVVGATEPMPDLDQRYRAIMGGAA